MATLDGSQTSDPPSDPPGYDDFQQVGRSGVDEWAQREHRRRQAWLAGPSEAERYEWALGQHDGNLLTALLQQPSLSLLPTDDEVEVWAQREVARRKAWVDGPSQAERLARARRRTTLSPAAHDDEDVEDWAAREQARRQAWAAGPTDTEKRAWALRHISPVDPIGRSAAYSSAYVGMPGVDPDADVPSIAAEIRRLTALAATGATYRTLALPYEALAQMVRTGLEWQNSVLMPRPRGRRIPF